ncbi:MAG: type II secretion system protein [candidate division Zixibacteria bacterium]|nr:type II secretion system protein [candidate division Zixibacteria bacterium]
MRRLLRIYRNEKAAEVMRAQSDARGLTLIELIMVLVIAGVLAAVAMQKLGPSSQTARVEETKQEMGALANAIVGDPELNNNGVRTSFGYVGDVGAMPANLDALMSDPGGYATWKGPYTSDRFAQTPDDYKKDAWQAAYLYSGGVTITSTGSGSGIVRQLANSTDELLRNRVIGNVYDLDGTPPGTVGRDSVRILMAVPNGLGGTAVKSKTPDAGGYFAFDSIPIGNHDLMVVYIPGNDTIKRFVSVLPGSTIHGDYVLSANVWQEAPVDSTEEYLTKIIDSDSLNSGCNGFHFWIENNTGEAVTISTVTLTWSGRTAYYRYFIWNGVTVFNNSNPKAGSGELVTFSAPQTIADGEKIRVEFDFFKSKPTGGPNVDMDNLIFTVTLSDGSTMTVTTEDCP